MAQNLTANLWNSKIYVFQKHNVPKYAYNIYSLNSQHQKNNTNKQSNAKISQAKTAHTNKMKTRKAFSGKIFRGMITKTVKTTKVAYPPNANAATNNKTCALTKRFNMGE